MSNVSCKNFPSSAVSDPLIDTNSVVVRAQRSLWDLVPSWASPPLPLQFECLRARTLHVTTRCIMKNPAVAEFPEGHVVTFVGTLQFIFETTLVAAGPLQNSTTTTRPSPQSGSPSESSCSQLAPALPNAAHCFHATKSQERK